MKRFLAVLTVAIIAAFGLGTSAGAAGPFDGIDNTGATDVTAPLNAALAALPNGTVATFPANGQYRIEGTLVLKSKDGITLDANGCTFFATTDGTGTVSQIRVRAQWKLQVDTNLTIKNMTVRGASTSPGEKGLSPAALEGQAGFWFQGVTNGLLTNVNVSRTWGDAVYVGALTVGTVTTDSSYVTVQDSSLLDTSRQGLSITRANHVTVQRNLISNIRRSGIDIEANVAKDQINFITISHNVFGNTRFSSISNAGAGSPQHDFVIDGNSTTGGRLNMLFWGTPTGRRQNYTVTNNTGRLVGGVVVTEPFTTLKYIDGVTVTGNRELYVLKPGTPPFPVALTCVTGAVVAGNDFGPKFNPSNDTTQHCP